MRRGAGVAVLAAAALGACGGVDRPAAVAPPDAAQPLAARSRVPSVVDRARPADYRAPIARYKRHVRRALGRMLADVADLRAALARGDHAAARAAWRRASARYETIGAAYGAFGALDRRIDGRPDGLPGGVRSPRFAGLHRIERALWAQRSTRAAQPYARRLAADVRRLRARVTGLAIDPLDYALRSHEILEDTLHLQLSGQASPWSGTALDALRANLRGTRVVLATLRPMLARRDTAGALGQSERWLRRTDRAVRALERPDGSLPRWDAIGRRDRERIAGLAAAAAEQLAYVPGLIDPRPPLPRKPALEAGR